MTQFYYKAMNQQGAIITGQLEAQSKEDVGLNLSKKRLTLLSLQQGKEKKQKSRSINLSVPKKSVLSFTRELLALTRAGLSLVESLELLIEQTTNENLQSILVDTCEKVKEGKSFSEVLQRYPRVFSDLYVNTVYIGEISGTLDQILESLIEHLENENQLRSDLKKAFRYPTFVVGSLIGAFILFITFVIPRFEPIFSKSETELPVPTKIILLMSELLTSYGFVLLALFFILGLALWLMYKTENGKYLIHSFLIKLPIYGNLLKKIAFYRFASTLSLLNRNGIPLRHLT
jgi:type IV pilus assembly protein PilC